LQKELEPQSTQSTQKGPERFGASAPMNNFVARADCRCWQGAILRVLRHLRFHFSFYSAQRCAVVKAAAKDDRTAAVTPAIQPTAPWRVREVTALPSARLFVRFVDGLTGVVDHSALIASPEAGVFARLRDRSLFEQVTVEMGAVVWPGELDLAPDAMHDAIKQHGEWKVQP
jgi:hypothetical protein